MRCYFNYSSLGSKRCLLSMSRRDQVYVLRCVVATCSNMSKRMVYSVRFVSLIFWQSKVLLELLHQFLFFRIMHRKMNDIANQSLLWIFEEFVIHDSHFPKNTCNFKFQHNIDEFTSFYVLKILLHIIEVGVSAHIDLYIQLPVT